MQNALNKFFKALGAILEVVTGSAYSQARQKISPEIFYHLNEIVSQDYYKLYGADGEVEKWRGHRLLGVDGTYLNLPSARVRACTSTSKCTVRLAE